MSFPYYQDDARTFWACTDTCEISDRYLWQCNENPGDNSKFHSNCTYLCGNKFLDQLDAGTDKHGRLLAEECDQLVQPHMGMTRSGLYNRNANYKNKSFSTINKSYETHANFDQSNIGCDNLCRIKPGFVCPTENSYDVGNHTIKGNEGNPLVTYIGGQLLCSDRVQDGVYDGPHVFIGRLYQTPSVKPDSKEFNSVKIYSKYDPIRVGLIAEKY